MANGNSTERKNRREFMKDLHRIVIADRLDDDLSEDILASAPEVQVLTLHLLDTEYVDLTLLSKLDALLTLCLDEGEEVTCIDLTGVERLKELVSFELNLAPLKPLKSLSLSPLRSHPEIRVVTIACPVKEIYDLDALATIPNLESVGFYALGQSQIDLTPLSNPVSKHLESIFLGDLGRVGCNDSFIPYRSAGPVTDWEYESRQERYDGQLKEIGIDISGLSTTEKNKQLREHREERYRLLTDAAYKRRGWTRNGVPTLDKVKELGLDWIPELVEIVKKHGSSKPPKDTLPASDEAWA